MADFCKQCAHDTWGPDIPSDFKGGCERGQFQQGLCEGCGLVVTMNSEGERVLSTCPPIRMPRATVSHSRDHLLTCDIEAVRRCDAAGIDWTQKADGELTREMGRLLSEITRRLEKKQ